MCLLMNDVATNFIEGVKKRQEKKREISNWSFELWSFFRALNLSNHLDEIESKFPLYHCGSVSLCPRAQLCGAWCWITYDWSLLIMWLGVPKWITFVEIEKFIYLFEMATFNRSALHCIAYTMKTRTIITYSHKSRWSFRVKRRDCIMCRTNILPSTFQ